MRVLQEPSDEGIIRVNSWAWDSGDELLGIAQAAARRKSGESEDLGEKKGEGRGREKRASEDMAMDLVENSQIRTSLNQCSESSFSFFFQLYFSLVSFRFCRPILFRLTVLLALEFYNLHSYMPNAYLIII